MANRLSINTGRRFLLCATALAITVTPFAPCYAISTQAVTIGDIKMALKLEKLIARAYKYYKKENSKKLVEVMLDIKHETEAYTGKKIDISKYLHQIEKKIKDKGGKISQQELDQIKKTIKEGEARHNHQALYMASAMESGCDYNAEAIEIEWNYLCNSASTSKDKDSKEEITLPVRVTVGVTIALVGLFITVLPFPPCKTWGPTLISAGVGLAIEGGCGKIENDRKEERDRNKK
jgi:hypothetical protein